MALAPLDTQISIAALTDDPYPIYQRLRRESPVLRVQAVGRTMLTKAATGPIVHLSKEVLAQSADHARSMSRHRCELLLAFEISLLVRLVQLSHELLCGVIEVHGFLM